MKGFCMRLAIAMTGFIAGFLLTVNHWAAQWGVDSAEAFAASSASAAVLCVVCVLFVEAWTPGKKTLRRSRGLSLAPAMFLFPFAVSTVGLRAALWFLA